MQNELEAEYPQLDIQILAINEWGQEQGNALASAGRDLPLLQDEDANQDSQSDVWTSWGVEWRDLVFVDALMEYAGSFNLTTYDLANAENYSAAKDIFVGAAQQKAFWQNPVNRLDVNDDGLLTPIQDVLSVINELNARNISAADGRLPLPMPDRKPTPYYDVNGDGFLTPVQDLLPVINALNAQPAGGDGESAAEAIVSGQTIVLPILTPEFGQRSASAFSPVQIAEDLTSDLAQVNLATLSLASTLPVFANDEAVARQIDPKLARIWDSEPTSLLGAIEDVLP